MTGKDAIRGIHGKYHKEAAPAADERAIPLKPNLVVTPIVQAFPNGVGDSIPGRAQLCSVYKQAMIDAGRGDEDWRCALYLFALETAWGRACFWRNSGNRKARPGWDESSDSVFTTNPHASCAYILTDRLHSTDFYYGFDTWADTLKDEYHLLGEYKSPGAAHPFYDGVIQAYRQGDLDGLLRAREVMLRAGYSGPGPTSPQWPNFIAAELSEARGYWNHMARILPDVFVR